MHLAGLVEKADGCGRRSPSQSTCALNLLSAIGMQPTMKSAVSDSVASTSGIGSDRQQRDVDRREEDEQAHGEEEAQLRRGAQASDPPSEEKDSLLSEGDGVDLEPVLDRLVRDADLLALLSDEKMRSQVHKENYERLKAEHTRLQQQLQWLSSDLAQLEGERTSGSALKSPAAESASDDELRVNLFEALDDLEAAKASMQTLLQENLSLRSAVAHLTSDGEAQIQELQLKYDLKVRSLEKTVSEVRNAENSWRDASDFEMAKLKQQNATLENKVKFLEECLEKATSSLREHEESAARASAETAKDASLLRTSVRRLEAEKHELESALRRSGEDAAAAKLRLQEAAVQIAALNAEVKRVGDAGLERQQAVALELNVVKMARVTERSSLQCQIDHAERQLKGWQMEAMAKSAEVESIKRAKSERARDLKAALVEAENRNKVDSREIFTLRAEVDALKRKLSEATANVIGQERFIDERRAKIALLHENEVLVKSVAHVGVQTAEMEDLERRRKDELLRRLEDFREKHQKFANLINIPQTKLSKQTT